MKNKFINEICLHFSPQVIFRIIVVICLAAILLAPGFIKMIHVWYSDPDSSHGFFVIPICLYMIWLKRERLSQIETKTSLTGCMLLALSLITYVVSYTIRFNTLLYLSMILIIISTVLFLAGWRIMRVLMMPFLFLIFMVPFPNSYEILITNSLKLIVTEVSAWLLNMFGIPVFQEGNLLIFANYQLEVAEACSGVRSLISYLMLGLLFAVLSRKAFTKLIIILTTLALSITVNVIRVTTTGILAGFFGVRVAQGFFHEFTGFVLFFIGFVVLFLEYYLIETRFNDKTR